MKSQFRAVNRFISKIKSTSSIDGISNSGTFQVEDITVAGFSLPQGAVTFYVTADFAQTGKEEIFRVVNVAGDVLTYDKRISVGGYVKPSHASGASIRVNDVADIINEMSENIDNFGKVAVIAGTQTLKVWGGIFNNNGTIYNVSTSTLAVAGGQLVDNSTNYIHFVLSTQLFTVTASSTLSGAVCMASVVVSGGVIGAIADLRPGFATTYGEIVSKLDKSGGLRDTMGASRGIMEVDGSGNEVKAAVVDGINILPTETVRKRKGDGTYEDVPYSFIQSSIRSTGEYYPGIVSTESYSDTSVLSILEDLPVATTPDIYANIGSTTGTSKYVKTIFSKNISGNSIQLQLKKLASFTTGNVSFRICNVGTDTVVNANATVTVAIGTISNGLNTITFPGSFSCGAEGTNVDLQICVGDFSSPQVNLNNVIGVGSMKQLPTSDVFNNANGGTGAISSNALSFTVNKTCYLVSLGNPTGTILPFFETGVQIANIPVSGILDVPIQLITGKTYTVSYAGNVTGINTSSLFTLGNHIATWSSTSNASPAWTSFNTASIYAGDLEVLKSSSMILNKYISKAILSARYLRNYVGFAKSAGASLSFPTFAGSFKQLSSLLNGTTYYANDGGLFSATPGAIPVSLGVAIQGDVLSLNSGNKTITTPITLGVGNSSEIYVSNSINITISAIAGTLSLQFFINGAWTNVTQFTATGNYAFNRKGLFRFNSSTSATISVIFS